MKRFNFALALLPLILITGCITGAIRGKQAQACSSLTTLSRTIAVLNQVASGPTSPVNALKQAEEQVSAAFRDFRKSTEEDQEPKTDELKKAYQDLEEAYENLDKEIKNLPDQSTMAQARTSIADNLTTTESALAQVKSSLRCR